jgi:hypothetical protein
MTNDLLQRIQGEFLEMPGLRLTPEQAALLWGLDQQTCTAVLSSLVVDKFLVCRADGRYTRLTEGSVTSSSGSLCYAASPA